MASILRVNTLTDASSNNSIAMSVVNQGTAKAWLQYNQVTPAVTGSYNISSVTDTGAGDFTPNYSSAMSALDYAVSNLLYAFGSQASLHPF